MFREQTVFVLGAGASWHYGYPTGAQLIADVVDEAGQLADHFARWGSYGQFLSDYAKAKAASGRINTPTELNKKAKQDCIELVEKIRAVNPLVIDYFLGWNPDLKQIGKLVIALVILKAEYRWAHLRYNMNRQFVLKNSPYLDERERRIDASKFRDDWCRFVINQLVGGSTSFQQILESPVTFITFNYDTSLERRLYEGLRSLQMFRGEPVEQFFTKDRFVHVYGQVGSYDHRPEENIEPSANRDDVDGVRRYIQFLNRAYDAGNSISIIAPDEKDSDEAKIKPAQERLHEAKNVYILGYGFDPENNRRLGLSNSLRYNVPVPKVSFTNFLDSNRINERASEIFFGGPGHFDGGLMKRNHCSRSVRDVYSALELDFEMVG
jgi:hypothetical protein